MATSTTSGESIEQENVVQLEGGDVAPSGEAISRKIDAAKSSAVRGIETDGEEAEKGSKPCIKPTSKVKESTLNSEQITAATNVKAASEELPATRGEDATSSAITQSSQLAATGSIQQGEECSNANSSLSTIERPSTKPPVKKRPPLDAAAARSRDGRSPFSTKKKEQSPSPKAENVLAIPISNIETQVYRAARLVAVELEYGAWPEVTLGARRRAACAMEEFAKTIYLPNLLAQSDPTTTPDAERIFVSTMLALREVLTQNASRIFAMESVELNGDTESNDTDTEPGAKRRKRACQEEERQYMAQLFASGVVFSAIQSIGTSEADACLQRLTQAMDSYDTGGQEFASHMRERDGRHEGITPNLKKLSNQENLAWKVSFNRARAVHPVVRRSKNGTQDSQVVKVPSPNAVFIAMVEDQLK